MHHPVAHSNQAVVLTLTAQEFGQVGNRAFMTKSLAVAPHVRTDFRPCAIFCDESRRTVEALHLPAELKLNLICTFDEHRELNA
jgi:hypothetical protein